MRLSKGAIVALLIGLVVVILVTYFTAEIKNFVALRAWSKGATRAVAARVVEAIQNRDAAAIEEFCGGPVKPTEADGKLVSLGIKGGMAPPPVSVENLTPVEGVDKARIAFQVRPPHGTATVTMSGPNDSEIVLTLKPEKGKWSLWMVSSSSRAQAAAAGGKTVGPGAQKGAGKAPGGPEGASKGAGAKGMSSKGMGSKGAGAIGSPVGGGSPKGAPPDAAPAT